MNVGNILGQLLKRVGKDSLDTLGVNYSADHIANLAASSADDIARTQGNLIATHQLFPEKLASAAELGGFVQPSMAVVDPSKATNFLPGGGFGDILMVAKRDAIDPKNKAANAIIGDRDIYSPRFPETAYDINTAALDDFAKQSGSSRQYAASNLGIDDDPKYSYFLTDLYNKQNPQAASMSLSELRNDPDFLKFADDAFGQLRGDQKLVQRMPSGSLKKLPYTAENANKIMNKSASVGGEMGWNTPTAQAYHQNTTKFKSLDDAYKNRYRLINSEAGDITKDAINDEFFRITQAIDDLNIPMFSGDSNSFTRLDGIGGYLADAVSGRQAMLKELPKELVDDIGRLSEVYKKAPVSYFEAKPRRVVSGNEFYGAYIPESSSPEVIEQLQRLGVDNIKKYLDQGDLDLQLSQLAKEGKRGVSPYVLGTAGALPVGGSVLAALLGGGNEQMM